MNIFRLLGDMSHLLSIIVLLLKIRATRSCRGTNSRFGIAKYGDVICISTLARGDRPLGRQAV